MTTVAKLGQMTARESTAEPAPMQAFFSIAELAQRWRCSRGTVYNRLRLAGGKVLHFGVAGRKSKKLVPVAVVLHLELNTPRPSHDYYRKSHYV